MLPTLANLDSKEKTTKATDQDVFQALNWCFQNSELDDQLATMMHESAAMFVMASQLRAMRGLITNPQQFATKLVCDAPEAVEFKNSKTVPAMQKMITAMCVSTTGSTSTRPTDFRSLAGQLQNPSSSTASAASLVLPPTSQQTQLVPPQAQAPAAGPVAFQNQLMDLVLQLQGQMQQMQQASNPPVTSETTTAKPKRRTKRKASSSASSASAETVTGTVEPPEGQQDQEQDEEQPQITAKKPKKKKKKQARSQEDE